MESEVRRQSQVVRSNADHRCDAELGARGFALESRAGRELRPAPRRLRKLSWRGHYQFRHGQIHPECGVLRARARQQIRSPWRAPTRVEQRFNLVECRFSKRGRHESSDRPQRRESGDFVWTSLGTGIFLSSCALSAKRSIRVHFAGWIGRDLRVEMKSRLRR